MFPSGLQFGYLSEFHVRDAWAKHKDLGTHEAKQMYVEALLKVGRYISNLSRH
jgi:hypothetical protein